MARLSYGVKCAAAALFALNIIFLVIGLTVMSLGVYVKVNGHFSAISDINKVSEALGKEIMQWMSVGLIIIGIFTAILAAMGCLGALLQNRSLLYIYTISLSVIVLLEFATVIIVLVYRNDVWNSYDSSYMEIFRRAYSHNETATIGIIQDIERKFQCCGVDGSFDYLKFGYKIPSSCYSNEDPYTGTIFNNGCAKGIIVWMWNKLPFIAGSLGGILFIELFGIITSIALAVAISHSRKYEEYLIS